MEVSTNSMEHRHFIENFEDDPFDEFFAVAVSLLLEEAEHVSGVGLVLHEHHRIDRFENFNKW